MRHYFVLSMLSLLPLPAQVATRVPLSESKHSITGFAFQGQVQLSALRYQVEIKNPPGDSRLVDMTVIHDPRTKYFFWKVARLTHKGDNNSFLTELISGREAVFSEQDSIVDFYMPGDLWFQVHTQKADTLDSASALAIDSLQNGLAHYSKNGFDTGGRSVSMDRRISNQFFCGEENPSIAVCGMGAKRISSITHTDGKWVLVISNRYDQEIILDRNFNLVSTRPVR